MTIRKIAQIGHPVLRQVARALTQDELLAPSMQLFIDDLVATYSAPREKIHADVTALLQGLVEKRLLEL